MPESTLRRGIRIAIDRGGTFCDVFATIPDHKPLAFKILSSDPSNYADAPTEAVRRVLSVARDRDIPRSERIDLGDVESIRMGTTVATNALLERKGEPTAFLVTKGFRDLLVIGNQSRPDLFDLSVRRVDAIPSATVEVDERVVLAGDFALPDLPIIPCNGSDSVQIERALDMAAVERDLRQLHCQGYRSLAVALLHSYLYPQHELLIGQKAIEVGFEHVSLSSQVAPVIKAVSRAHSATADAYLTPELRRTVDAFLGSFHNIQPGMVQFMQSDGGLVSATSFSGLRAILSGPAGGVCGLAATCFDEEDGTPVIGFDMGGTSTDVSRYDGSFAHVLETTTAGVTIQTPQLDINTVAAGGGSILFWRNGMFAVGPESAGAHPGPACYRKGGPLTITDANLMLGRIILDSFPCVFGPNENEPLDVEVVKAKFAALAEEISADTGKPIAAHEVALGFIAVANESMCQPVRALTEAKGHSLASHNLAVFGGAGGQHACGIAEALEIERVLLHRHASILSAYGIALADMVQDKVVAFHVVYEPTSMSKIKEKVQQMKKSALQELVANAAPFASTEVEVFLNMRFDGTDTSLMVRQQENGTDCAAVFHQQHQREFGFTLQTRKIVVEEIRVRAVGRTGLPKSSNALMSTIGKIISRPIQEPTDGCKRRHVYFAQHGWIECPVFELSELQTPNLHLAGPCMMIDSTQTIVVAPGYTAAIAPEHVVLNRAPRAKVPETPKLLDDNDAVTLSIFAHKFMSIAERMGGALQKTSVSVNIKERLDFSCSIFTAQGDLVANAPHVPAMLGSMAFAVKYQLALWKGKLAPGDVLLSNHPVAGGVHLPDMTVITPVFDDGELIFCLASRGHHADVGGILPGSMPPHSKTIFDEGASIESLKVVEAGTFKEEELTRLLVDEPQKQPGGHGTRTLADNVSDIRAQIAANNRGSHLLGQLVNTYGLASVQSHMKGIQRKAEGAVRKLLRNFGQLRNFQPATAVDYMDDGTPIRLEIAIDEQGGAVFDFTGTGPEVLGNWNAPTAICFSSIIYALRSMLATDMPLNQGCLDPLKVIVPPNSLLSPSRDAAVCGGNVLTSQRITDVILKAFEACAASQGCMNNLTFGYQDPNGDTLGFYETIAGGSGAGPTWHGTSGVQTHMTNTRIGDAEVMERRYPVIVREFCIRPESGGAGLHRGGDGVVREIEFRRPLTCSILSERRSRAPYGMAGGQDADVGRNYWLRADAKQPGGYLPPVSLGGKNSTNMKQGDRIRIMTPGGGGYGTPTQAHLADVKTEMPWVPVANGSWSERAAIQASN
ncbi:hypothetical protein FA10DRAFT_255151 [Acaromyces ingoldii]|uniref:5-oxoprolinase n=1 Tax=Acaromyces ingoldii TaxID=215250 RepID=A0A316YI97_9BASI|nr:hypothetical protein FA10DRAFT_255151 [Acaromyces ingoldii]PWN88796.1 hypothetical protein FA10DRAFT_255151 [Acaromyces ingoldii]